MAPADLVLEAGVGLLDTGTDLETPVPGVDIVCRTPGPSRSGCALSPGTPATPSWSLCPKSHRHAHPPPPMPGSVVYLQSVEAGAGRFNDHIRTCAEVHSNAHSCHNGGGGGGADSVTTPLTRPSVVLSRFVIQMQPTDQSDRLGDIVGAGAVVKNNGGLAGCAGSSLRSAMPSTSGSTSLRAIISPGKTTGMPASAVCTDLPATTRMLIGRQRSRKPWPACPVMHVSYGRKCCCHAEISPSFGRSATRVLLGRSMRSFVNG